jgi:hypothetical protein
MKHVRLSRTQHDPGSDGRSDPSPTLRRRLRVQLRRGRLDHQIADGFDPEAFEDRALRARQLASVSARRKVARSLREVVRAADRPAVISSAIPVSRVAVTRWREAVLGLAERLEGPEPVNPCGVARALVLLTSGSGALYDPGAASSMGEAVWWIADGLRLCPPHDWGCPVVMKVEPEHVAWTCARCGAIATAHDAGELPA